MKIIDDLFLLERLDYLIRSKSTGAPYELANRLGICKRHIYRLIANLKDYGLPVNYDKLKKTYYYSDCVFLRFEISVGDVMLVKIKGGLEER